MNYLSIKHYWNKWKRISIFFYETNDFFQQNLLFLFDKLFSSIDMEILYQIVTFSQSNSIFVYVIFRLPVQKFKDILQRLHNLIACRLFPPKQQDLPALAKCTWWIPSATKVLALISKSLLNINDNTEQNSLLNCKCERCQWHVQF